MQLRERFSDKRLAVECCGASLRLLLRLGLALQWVRVTVMDMLMVMKHMRRNPTARSSKLRLLSVKIACKNETLVIFIIYNT